MSVNRCFSCVLRSRVALEKLALPVVLSADSISRVTKIPEQNAIFLKNVCSVQQMSVRKYGKRFQKGRSSSSSSSSSSSDSSDSDSGKGVKKGRQGQSAFWRQKMRTHHMAIDLNNDGVVSWDDFDELIKNFSSLGNLSEQEIQKLSDVLRHVWEEEWGASGDPYAFIGFEQFLSRMEHVVNSKDLRKKVASPLPYFFSAVDWDSSGEISIDEFTTFYKCLKLPEEAAIEAFNAIDLNGDGKLSKKEFVRLGKEFFLSEDEANPSKFFWGPLDK